MAEASGPGGVGAGDSRGGANRAWGWAKASPGAGLRSFSSRAEARGWRAGAAGEAAGPAEERGAGGHATGGAPAGTSGDFSSVPSETRGRAAVGEALGGRCTPPHGGCTDYNEYNRRGWAYGRREAGLRPEPGPGPGPGLGRLQNFSAREAGGGRSLPSPGLLWRGGAGPGGGRTSPARQGGGLEQLSGAGRPYRAPPGGYGGAQPLRNPNPLRPVKPGPPPSSQVPSKGRAMEPHGSRVERLVRGGAVILSRSSASGTGPTAEGGSPALPGCRPQPQGPAFGRQVGPSAGYGNRLSKLESHATSAPPPGLRPPKGLASTEVLEHGAEPLVAVPAEAAAPKGLLATPPGL